MPLCLFIFSNCSLDCLIYLCVHRLTPLCLTPAQETGFDMLHSLDSDFNIQPLTFSSIPSFHHFKACGRITFFFSLGMLCAAFVSIFFKHVAASSNHTGQIKTSHSPSSIMLISLCMLRFASTYIRTLCLSPVRRDGQSPSHSGHGSG